MNKNTSHKLSNLIAIGFLQAISVVVYCIGISYLMNHLPAEINYNPFISGYVFLITFITSALLTASMVFAYPIFLFLDKRQQEAVKIVLITTFWLVILFKAIIISLFLLNSEFLANKLPL